MAVSGRPTDAYFLNILKAVNEANKEAVEKALDGIDIGDRSLPAASQIALLKKLWRDAEAKSDQKKSDGINVYVFFTSDDNNMCATRAGLSIKNGARFKYPYDVGTLCPKTLTPASNADIFSAQQSDQSRTYVLIDSTDRTFTAAINYTNPANPIDIYIESTDRADFQNPICAHCYGDVPLFIYPREICSHKNISAATIVGNNTDAKTAVFRVFFIFDTYGACCWAEWINLCVASRPYDLVKLSSDDAATIFILRQMKDEWVVDSQYALAPPNSRPLSAPAHPSQYYIDQKNLREATAKNRASRAPTDLRKRDTAARTDSDNDTDSDKTTDFEYSDND